MEPADSRKPIRRALLSVSDKTGLAEVGRALADAGAELVATSSTAADLREGGLSVIEVSDLTGFPEILGGRVKTLHPAVHAGILARQDHPESMASLARQGIAAFDAVVVNLYPFAKTLASGASQAECIEMIDIGGPTLIRAAAKNFASVAVVSSPTQYADFIEALRQGGTTRGERFALATEAFQSIANYDIAIANWMSAGADSAAASTFPSWTGFSYEKKSDLRYGENPHQGAAVYVTAEALNPPGEDGRSLASAELLNGKPLSYNNLQDADAAWKAVPSFSGMPAVAIIKHANPCGLAVAPSVAQAYDSALACDPLSAFGGVVAASKPIDATAAKRISRIFTEVVIAPSYTGEALEILRKKANLRVLSASPSTTPHTLRPIDGGLLIQDADGPRAGDRIENWELVAGHPADADVAADLQFAWRAAQYVKSNAILLARNLATVGVGMGQVNRVDAAKLAVERANTLGPEKDGDAPQRTLGAVAASDAFFPFPDGLSVLADAGVTAIVAPGGSRNDALVVEAAQRSGVTLYFTGLRHFAH